MGLPVLAAGGPRIASSLHCALVYGVRWARRPVAPGVPFGGRLHLSGPLHPTTQSKCDSGRIPATPQPPQIQTHPLPRCASAARAAAHPSVPSPQTRPGTQRIGGAAWRRWRQGRPQRRRGRGCGGGEWERQGPPRTGCSGRPGVGPLGARGARGGAGDARGRATLTLSC